MIVVGDQDDPARVAVGRTIDRADVDRVRLTVTAVGVCGLLEAATEERRESRRLEARDDLRASTGVALGAAESPLELRRGEVTNVGLDGRDVDAAATLSAFAETRDGPAAVEELSTKW